MLLQPRQELEGGRAGRQSRWSKEPGRYREARTALRFRDPHRSNLATVSDRATESGGPGPRGGRLRKPRPPPPFPRLLGRPGRPQPYSALLHLPPPLSKPQTPRTIGAWWKKLPNRVMRRNLFEPRGSTWSRIAGLTSLSIVLRSYGTTSTGRTNPGRGLIG